MLHLIHKDQTITAYVTHCQSNLLASAVQNGEPASSRLHQHSIQLSSSATISNISIMTVLKYDKILQFINRSFVL